MMRPVIASLRYSLGAWQCEDHQTERCHRLPSPHQHQESNTNETAKQSELGLGRARVGPRRTYALSLHLLNESQNVGGLNRHYPHSVTVSNFSYRLHKPAHTHNQYITTEVGEHGKAWDVMIPVLREDFVDEAPRVRKPCISSLP